MTREKAKPPKRWKHKKRGTIYRILHHNVPMQCSGYSWFDDKSLVIYQDVENEKIYARLAYEFFDGRFEPV